MVSSSPASFSDASCVSSIFCCTICQSVFTLSSSARSPFIGGHIVNLRFGGSLTTLAISAADAGILSAVILAHRRAMEPRTRAERSYALICSRTREGRGKMRCTDFGRHALSSCAVAALLAGCGALRQAQGDTQPPIAQNATTEAFSRITRSQTFHFTGGKQNFIV